MTPEETQHEQTVRREMERRLIARGWLAAPGTRLAPSLALQEFVCPNGCGRVFRSAVARLCKPCAMKLQAQTRRAANHGHPGPRGIEQTKYLAFQLEAQLSTPEELDRRAEQRNNHDPRRTT